MAIGLTNEQSHAHSVSTLEILNRYQSYMDNIKNVTDMGCGMGLDAEWFATLTKKDDNSPRNIKVNAVDLNLDTTRLIKHPNITYYKENFNNSSITSNSQDLLWAHNSLQYSLTPFNTLIHWREILKTDGMMFITVPYNFRVYNNKETLSIDTTYTNGCYYNWTMGNLILNLVLAGFDCRNGHFKIDKEQNWLQAAVYKLPFRPKPSINWYELCDQQLLPLTIENSIRLNGNFNEADIVVEWIDRTQYMLSI
jgi:SAM-dependent methyltransferase